MVTLKQVYEEMYFQYKDKKQAIDETLYYFLAGFYADIPEETKQAYRSYIETNI